MDRAVLNAALEAYYAAIEHEHEPDLRAGTKWQTNTQNLFRLIESVDFDDELISAISVSGEFTMSPKLSDPSCVPTIQRFIDWHRRRGKPVQDYPFYV